MAFDNMKKNHTCGIYISPILACTQYLVFKAEKTYRRIYTRKDTFIIKTRVINMCKNLLLYICFSCLTIIFYFDYLKSSVGECLRRSLAVLGVEGSSLLTASHRCDCFIL